MSAIIERRRLPKEVDKLVQADFERYRGRIILVHYAVDFRRFGRVNVNFVPPLLARISAKASVVEWDKTGNFCDASYAIIPLELHHDDLAGMENLHINAPGRSLDPALDEYWLNHWSVAKRQFGWFGNWVAVARKETSV